MNNGGNKMLHKIISGYAESTDAIIDILTVEEIPAHFTSKSQITRYVKAEHKNGLILDSPEEVVAALIAYSGESAGTIEASCDDGEKGVKFCNHDDIFTYANAKYGLSFIKQLLTEALQELKSQGDFHRSFSHDAAGTKFNFTTVTGDRINGKYILTLQAQEETEKDYAAMLNKPMAMICATSRIELSVVDDWWYNINLEEILKGLSFTSKQLEEFTQHFVSRSGGQEPEMEFMHNNRKFVLKIRLDVTRPYKKGEDMSYFFQARGKSLVGGSWSTRNWTGEPRVVPPAIEIDVTLPGEYYHKDCSDIPLAVTEDDMNSLIAARDYIESVLKGEVILPVKKSPD
ncbi:hypothetical protein ACFL4D_02600 [Candidatus Margulisiibacteriota bacterium]